jgi:DNA uptake protein ComE-like DNA-binding protein
MNILKRWVRNLFGFSGKEINGFLILLPLMVIFIASEPVYRMWLAGRTDDFTTDRRHLDSLAQLWKTVPPEDTISRASLFEFNPNKVSVADMQRLGFSESLSTRIANYRQKGGQFRVKPDLLKIYGMDSALYAQLYAYILLPETKEKTFDKQHEKSTTQSQKTLLTSFDLNQADTTELKSVYGIGSKLASRIIRFREGLGGFVKQEQVKEVYGLDTTVTQQLLKISYIAEDFTPRKINLNTANETEFSAHPYIKKAMAKAIIAYRFQHGKFADVQELKKLTLLKEEEADKIIPYLKIAE